MTAGSLTATPDLPGPDETPEYYAPPAQRAGLIEFLLFFLWYIAVITPLPGGGLTRYVAAATMLIFMFPIRAQIVQTAKDMSFVFLVPAVMALSILWSPAKAQGAEFVAALLLAYLVVIFGATRASFNQIMLVFLVGLSIGALASFINPNTQAVFGHGQSADVGVFGQKNYMGKRMMVLCIISFYVVTSRDFQWWWRMLSMGTLVLGYILVIRSDSATALLLTSGALAMLAVLQGGWRQFAQVKGAVGMTIAALLFIVAGAAFWLSLNAMNPVEAVLAMLGKDSTLTGRTELWEYARRFIAANPLKGIGIEGFWRPEHSDAVYITQTFTKVPGSYRFSFHNAYLEYGVHFGIPGMIALAVSVAMAAFIILRDFLVYKDARGAVALTLAVVVIMRTFTEAEFYSQAEINVMLLYTAVAFAVRRRRVDQDPSWA